jgi:hypothetical protein
VSLVLFLGLTRVESNKTRIKEGQVFIADGSTQKSEESSQEIGLLYSF